MNTRKLGIVRTTALAVAALATAGALTGCAGGEQDTATAGGAGAGAAADPSGSATVPAGEHNAADVAFAQGMIPHHRQAVEMAELAADRAADPAVRDLADAVERAQQPEIDTMTAWLTAWGEDVPQQGDMGDMDHGGHGDHGSPSASEGDGMMTEEEMAELEAASGTEFDRMWMEMMIRHHEGAVAMATTEQQDGAYPPAVELAGQVIRTQQAEIDRMRQMLDELGRRG
ncbi:DUF305 domain-containing protein [Allostreptomyces psammosilenae]|uniref:Uncharacterized protein (DUF305 family) n=1 Tax=Allostreptomyces psammosilenae TaxID=1892865 RepID=A0A852ZQ98_9ACTN|nr:DUF305 domain-containing protein [Allostreptomyces psammosilenae]NYI03925.1 uncharacterized protein (DUF305 family) [Allostreptomyces psammosilenae]